MVKVLYVEDEPDIRREISEELDDCGFTVVSAENGAVGLDVITGFKPDVILCDCLMPVMSGPEMLKKLRASYPEFADTPFVLFSAYADKSHLDEAAAAGATAYLTKPVDFEQLEALLRDLIRKPPVLSPDEVDDRQAGAA